MLTVCTPTVRGKSESTSINLYIDGSESPRAGPKVSVPHNITQVRFLVKPSSLLVRYRLEGLEQAWRYRPDEMLFMVRFLNKNGDNVMQESFPASGRSVGWKGSVETSGLTSRRETLTVPPGAEYLSVGMSSAGAPSVVGTFAVTEIAITSVGNGRIPGRTFLSDSRVPEAMAPLWIKSGTHPSMASALHLDDDSGISPVFLIVDDDITAHADWVTGIYSLPKVTPGEILDVRWKETYYTGLGGNFSASYERLPPGEYRFEVEDLSMNGDSLKSLATFSVTVPRPFWKNFWFWGAFGVTTAILSTHVGRQLIRRRINRHLQQAQLIADERLRIARDLHDDLGTRLSHISLLGAFAESSSPDNEARASFRQITAMSRELISALSETVWMLNPKNNELEALVDFLCRLVSELCRLAEIRCRIDAMSISENVSVSHEFRHNVSLAVKEIVNNALKHSFATEIKMTIRLEDNLLKINVADNGIGITRDAGKTGLGLANITQRMTSIRGKCKMEQTENDGLKISLEAPIT